MAQPVVINSEIHKNTKIKLGRGAEFGEAVHMVPVTARELQSLAVEYPIFFAKNPETEALELSVMLGFEGGENLFLEENTWDATYIPLNVLRQPFMVSVQRKSPDSEETSLVMTLDMDNPRVSETDGVALFDEEGKQSPLVEEMDKMLSALMQGSELTKPFVEMLTKLELIETVQLDLSFSKDDKRRLNGIHTISAEKLRALKGEQLETMHERGYVEACHLILASFRNVQKLITKKNLRTEKSA